MAYMSTMCINNNCIILDINALFMVSITISLALARQDRHLINEESFTTDGLIDKRVSGDSLDQFLTDSAHKNQYYSISRGSQTFNNVISVSRARPNVTKFETHQNTHARTHTRLEMFTQAPEFCWKKQIVTPMNNVISGCTWYGF